MEATPDLRQVGADVARDAAEQRRGAGSLTVHPLEKALLQAAEDGVDRELVQEREAIATEVVLVLKHRDLERGGAVLPEKQAEVLVQRIATGAEDRVVQDDRIETHPPQWRWESKLGVRVPAVKIGVATDRGNVLVDRARIRATDGLPVQLQDAASAPARRLG